MSPLRLICWMMGHKWRRLRKAGGTYEGVQMADGMTVHDPRIRICRRCSETRLAKARKSKP